MKMSEIRNRARSLGIEQGNMSKAELIRSIQKAEHYEPCYGTSEGQCGRMDCCFRDDCLRHNFAKKADVQINRSDLDACIAMIQRINAR